jgi:hypothetical protein
MSINVIAIIEYKKLGLGHHSYDLSWDQLVMLYKVRYKFWCFAVINYVAHLRPLHPIPMGCRLYQTIPSYFLPSSPVKDFQGHDEFH